MMGSLQIVEAWTTEVVSPMNDMKDAVRSDAGKFLFDFSILSKSTNRRSSGRVFSAYVPARDFLVIAAQPLGLSSIEREIMIRTVRRIEHIEGVGGPFIERTMGDPEPGGCLYVGLERAPGYRPEPSRVPSIAAISVSFAVGVTAGSWFVAWL